MSYNIVWHRSKYGISKRVENKYIVSTIKKDSTEKRK